MNVDVRHSEVPQNDTPLGEIQPPVLHREDTVTNLWRSCCGSRIDRRAALFFTQAGISGCIIFFCIFQLIFNSSCETDPVYVGLLSSTLAYWLPQPKM